MEGGRRLKGLSPEQPPLVSVVMAIYNGGATLERAIKSVINQTCPHYEFILVDGGSTDCTIDLLRKYENSIEYWISEPDKGIYDALNKGITLARGEWLYFIGSDDMLANDNVFDTVFSQPYDSKFVYGDVFYGDTSRIYGGEFTNIRLTKENICQQGIFYRASLFRIIGKFNVKYPLVADWVFNMQAFCLRDAKPIYINLIIAEYCLAGASNQNLDYAFDKDRFALIKKHLGFSCYIVAKFARLKDKIVANYKKYIVGTLLNPYSRRQRP